MEANPAFAGTIIKPTTTFPYMQMVTMLDIIFSRQNLEETNIGMNSYKYSSSFLDDKIFAMGEDIAMEVLCRLPVKPLFTFNCVSKKRNSFINHPSF